MVFATCKIVFKLLDLRACMCVKSENFSKFHKTVGIRVEYFSRWVNESFANSRNEHKVQNKMIVEQWNHLLPQTRNYSERICLKNLFFESRREKRKGKKSNSIFSQSLAI